MDKDIVNLIESIDVTLSLVEDVDVLKDKLKRFVDTIQQILETVHECASLIKKYLEANVAGTNPMTPL